MKESIDLMVMGWVLVGLTFGTLFIAVIWICVKLRKGDNNMDDIEG